MSLFSAATDGGLAYTVKYVLDDIFIARDRSKLVLIALVVVGLYSSKSILRFSLNYTLRYMGQKVVEKIRNQLYKKIITLPVSFFSSNSTGTLISRITNDVNMMQSSIPVTVSVVRDVLSVIGLVFIIFFMNPKMALIAIVVYPIFIHPLLLLSKRIRRFSKKGQEGMGVMTGILQETFSGVRVVKAFVQEKREIKRFEDANSNVVKFFLKVAMAAEITSPMMELVGSIGIAGIIYYGGLQIIRGEITAGELSSFLAAVAMVYEPAKRLGNSNSTIQQALAAAERVFDILSLSNSILDNDGVKDCEAKGKKVIFENVCFSYEDNYDVIKNFTLSVEPGATVAFVGHSGAGKSTIANLIPRFYDVTAGRILIGDDDIRGFKVHSLRENIGYVSQEPFLFDDTIFNNIAYTTEFHSEEDVVNAAKAAYIHDFIMSLPEQYNTITGERGVRLSGGQKQRITIARALLKNPPILILDEATSSLDTKSEREVQGALDNLMKNRTSFVIAHRFSTIINADMIVVLEDGEIKTKGTHKELIEKSDIYRKLYTMQAEETV